MKKRFLVLAYLGAIVAPATVRKLTAKTWTGKISTLYFSGDKEIAYYVFPGILYPPEDVIRGFFGPNQHDLHLVHYGHKDYDPEAAAIAAARHMQDGGYQKIRIISFSMGDQLLHTLGKCLPEYVKDGRIEIVSIDSLPNPEFIGDGYRIALTLARPLLKALRFLGGTALEIPCFKRDECWRSPAEVIEQLITLPSWEYDYVGEPIFLCVKAVIKDSRVFYDPKDVVDTFDDAFNCYEDRPSIIYFNLGGDLANIRDEATAMGYYKVFDNINWEF